MADIAQRGNKLTHRTRKFGGGRTNLLEQLGRVEAEPSNPNRRAEISRVHGELNKGYATGGRVGKFAGGVIKSVIKAGKKAGKKISDAARKQDTADSMKRFEHAGPHEGEVITKRILGKGTKKGDRTKAAVKDAMEAKPWVGKPHAAGGRIGKKWGRIVRPTRSRIHEMLGGGERGKPHSTKEGRQASGKRLLRRTYEAAKEHVKSKGPPSGRAEGGRIGLKKGGSDKKWIQKAVDPKHKGYCTPMTKKTCTPARKALARTFKKKAKTGW